MRKTILWAFVAVAFFCVLDSGVYAQDLDNNGIGDDLEFILASRFMPSFAFHYGNPLEPKPVEIMSPDSDLSPLGIVDVFRESYTTAGDFAYMGPYCGYYPDHCDEEILHRLVNADGVYASRFWFNHMEYGVAGDEDGTLWRNKYLVGGEGVLVPGVDVPSKIYAHLYLDSGNIVIQYWFFYPYDDWVINHEGDWEHINVVLGLNESGEHYISDIDYYFHNKYIILGGDLDKVHFVDETHPIVYVGGFASMECEGAIGSGHVSGASYPSTGSWFNVGKTVEIIGFEFCAPSAEGVQPDRYLSHREIDLEIMPKMRKLDDDNSPVGIGDAFFESNPQKAWMRANVYWGHRWTEAPSGWDFGNQMDASNGVGNLAPHGPLYQSTWENRSPSGFENYRNIQYPGPLYDSGKCLVVSLNDGDTEFTGFSVDLSNGGFSGLVELPCRLDVEYGEVVSVTVPDHLEHEGRLFVFKEWSGGADLGESDRILLTRSGLIQNHSETWNAVYGPAEMEDITDYPIRGVYRVTNSAELIDYNGDGFEDVYFAYGKYFDPRYHDASNFLVANDGNGSFSDDGLSSDLNGVGWGGPTVSVAVGDYDNDGDSDMYLSNGDSAIPNDPNVFLSGLFSQGGSGFQLAPTSYPTSFEDPHEGGRVEWIDVDSDGDLDLYVGRMNNPSGNLVFENLGADGSYSFVERFGTGLTGIGESGYFSWSDFDLDGDVDVFLFMGNGSRHRVLRNDGLWQFTDISSQLGMPIDLNELGRAAAWGDYDNDGDPDLLVCYHLTGLSGPRLFRNDITSFIEVTSEVGIPGDAISLDAVAWSDIDIDGDLDVILGSNPGRVLFNQFPSPFFEKTDLLGLELPSSPLCLTLADFDLDGDEDIYYGVRDPDQFGTNYSRLFRNDLEIWDNSVRIKLEGVVSNRDGIGSRVVVSTGDGVVQSRQTVGSVGGNSHPSKYLTIGLRDNAEATKVRVEWPWGRVTEVPSVDAGQTIIITDEFPAPQGGQLYLTTDSTGTPAGVASPVELGAVFDLYLTADLTDADFVSTGDMFSSIEGKLTIPEHMIIVSEEILHGGIDQDQSLAGYSLLFDQCLPADLGPVPLVHLRVGFWKEGGDATLTLGNIDSPTFSDPDPNVETVPSWEDCASSVLYRLEDPSVSGGYDIPILDTKRPKLIHSGLYLSSRSTVLLQFDEPIDGTFTNGLSVWDIDHYLVYNISIPSITKTVVVAYFISSTEVLVILDSDIPEGKEFNIEVSNVQDLHGNPAGVVIGAVTRSSGGGKVIFNEVMTGSGGAKSEVSTTVSWVELLNDGDHSISLNGWTVDVVGGEAIAFPELPIMVLQPGEFGVLAGNGYLMELENPEVVIYHSEDTYGVDTGLLIVSDPFGEQTDSVSTGTMLKLSADVGTSVQRFVEHSSGFNYWLADAPEYSGGLRGTPGKANRTSVDDSERAELPTSAHSAILYAAPNPFNPVTSIFLAVKERGHVSVVVYDLGGRKVKTLYNQFSEAKAQMELVWTGVDETGARVASGVYFVKMKAVDGDPRPVKITLLK